ncbi:MAG: hypothetical protein EBT92_14415 [Planctomycetes bacterium]|nr:hypothetical protein [Planctomycetota bacterium]
MKTETAECEGHIKLLTASVKLPKITQIGKGGVKLVSIHNPDVRVSKKFDGFFDVRIYKGDKSVTIDTFVPLMRFKYIIRSIMNVV